MTSADVAFDRSLLPPAELEFVVVADTHYMIDVGDAPLEFEGRRQQGKRAGAAWRAIAGLDPAFVVHMGDMVQEFPGRPDYDRTVREALDQIRGAGLWERCRFVVGNHDIGDRPDPTMPTGETTDESLDIWVQRHGASWHAWDAAGIHFLVLNSQLFNTRLPVAAEQRAWFEARLNELGHEPCVLFLHMPPYLHGASEPWLGHYDNLGEPDRSWLLDLVRRHRVEAMFSGHVHFQFFDHLDGVHVDDDASVCRYFVAPSTSFTRPGFSHLFTAAAPPQQGRDDLPKLGFFLCRRVGDRLDVHRVRMTAVAGVEDDAYLVNPVPAASGAADGFALGLTLRHALAPETEVPVAWPSVIRQPVRNDYPLLSCLELGAACVRAPVADLADPAQARRLAILRAEGTRVQAVALGEVEALEQLDSLAGADLLEVQLPGRALPEGDALRPLADGGLPLVLTPVLPGQPVPGKQHHRTRIGFLPGELGALGQALDEQDVAATVACRIDAASPWDAAAELLAARSARPWSLQLLAELPGVDEAANAAAAARALVVAASLQSPLFLEPLVDMDRTMDVVHGLLDPLCNPRPAFDVARSLAALVRGAGALGAPLHVTRHGAVEVAALGQRCCLVIAGEDGQRLGQVVGELAGVDDLRVCRLTAAAVTDYDPHAQLASRAGPLLVYHPAS